VRVAVLCGGRSAEREVSLRSGSQVAAALLSCGHEVDTVDADAHLWERLRDGRFDAVFIALHGRLGEDGTVQGLLELLGLPYTGSGVLASALCIDKSRTNRVLASAGLAVPEFCEVSGEPAESLIDRLGLPLVVKPIREGSTLGLTIARNVDEVASGVLLARRYDRRVMAQRFVAGVEITMGVLATPELQVLPSLEITYENETYDYDAKYSAGRSHHIIPARISSEAAERALAATATAFGALGCEGMARVDFIVDEGGTPWLLEVKTVPGLTEVSLLPDAARAADISFERLCQRLLDQGLARQRQQVGPAA